MKSAEVFCNSIAPWISAVSWTNLNSLEYERQQGFNSSYPIVMDDVQCDGTEKLIDNCTFIRTPNCNHWEDVIITCSEYNQTTSYQNYRLANPVNLTIDSPMGS